MRTARFSGRLGAGESAQGVCVCVCVCLPRGIVCLGGCTPPIACWDTPPGEQNDRQVWKHHLPATSFVAGNKRANCKPGSRLAMVSSVVQW